eukprot:31063-Pelagococcus_subviridis.AAC.3
MGTSVSNVDAPEPSRRASQRVYRERAAVIRPRGRVRLDPQVLLRREDRRRDVRGVHHEEEPRLRVRQRHRLVRVHVGHLEAVMMRRILPRVVVLLLLLVLPLAHHRAVQLALRRRAVQEHHALRPRPARLLRDAPRRERHRAHREELAPERGVREPRDDDRARRAPSLQDRRDVRQVVVERDAVEVRRGR